MDVFEYIDEHSERFVEELRRFCRQPSISTRHEGIEECAKLLREMMDDVGIDARIVREKEGHPVVLGEQIFKGAHKTLGFYNHYDVQPPEPLELWETPPFSADVRNGKIFARGVSDNKGNIMSRLKAVEAIKETSGEAPSNIKFFFEGEEEIGSPNLGPLVKENMDFLRADGYIWEGGGVDESDRPIISLGVKGLLYVELRVRGANNDVHSSQAPLIPNPAWRLIWALGTMKDEDENIRIDGWCDDVMEPTEEELKTLETMPFDEDAMKSRLGMKEFLKGRKGVEALKYLYFSPTCTVCGFKTGYTDSGIKTVLPCKAMTKVGFRLVEAQQPTDLLLKLKAHIKRHGFEDIEVTRLSGYEPCKTPINEPFAKFVIDKLKEVYGNTPVVIPTITGTSPQYTIKNWMGIPIVSGGGVGYPETRVHAPNENIRIKDYIRSIKFVAALMSSFE